MIGLEENVEMAPLTTLRVGGAARYFVRANSEEQLAEAFGFAHRTRMPVFVLGGGSNVLISDSGFDGLVIQVTIKGITTANSGPGRTDLTAAAGEDWDNFVEYCVGSNLSGIECLSGIPGLVGGTPVQNVGAYGQEVSETIVSVRCFDRREKGIVELTNAECQFGYRTSIFNTGCRDRYVVLAATFRLAAGGAPKIAYKDLAERFDNEQADLAEVRAAVLSIRRAKSMVIDEADPNSRSAGSFFKNPIVDRSRLDAIGRAAGGEKVPNFPVKDLLVKVPAAWLIEKSGFRKGFALGRAGISENHSLALVNKGGASAAEIVALKELIQAEVKARFGIELVPEPVMIGF